MRVRVKESASIETRKACSTCNSLFHFHFHVSMTLTELHIWVCLWRVRASGIHTTIVLLFFFSPTSANYSASHQSKKFTANYMETFFTTQCRWKWCENRLTEGKPVTNGSGMGLSKKSVAVVFVVSTFGAKFIQLYKVRNSYVFYYSKCAVSYNYLLFCC